MTIEQAIKRIDVIKPNSYSDSEKIAWLSRLDANIKKEIVDTHKGSELVSFKGYDSGTDKSTELIAPAPHDEMYLNYLAAQIDFANAEYGHYNNSISLFNAAYSAFVKYYNRTHVPLGCTLKIF